MKETANQENERNQENANQARLRALEFRLLAMSLGIRYDGTLALLGAPLALFTDTRATSPSYGATFAILASDTLASLRAKLTETEKKFARNEDFSCAPFPLA